ncbi:MAG: hypothetical protein K5985_05020 [Lachnospiraceae bacterium]|nr:hypothetical protein [Lachnospiraceae bacterium]
MKCIVRPYFGEGALRFAAKFRWKMKYGGNMRGFFLVTLPRFGNDLLEIYSFRMLNKRYYRLYPPLIVGVAKGYDEAVNTARRIVEETWRSTGGFDVKGYIMSVRGPEASE